MQYSIKKGRTSYNATLLKYPHKPYLKLKHEKQLRVSHLNYEYVELS